MIPRQVGNYRLDHLLGVGGMGEVYQAYDSHRERFVALKLLPEAFSADREYLKRFQRESHVAARLREPHVIPIHDFGEIDGRLFIDMRLVDGTDIRMLIDENGPMAPPRAVHLLGQVAQALDAAHADDLVHRDIKPSNILVTPNDFVYVVDFGIARSMGGRQTSLTITGATIGTLDYMAPERFAGHAVDGRADIYSLACLLHECLTATPPFEGKDLPSLMYAHLSSSPPRASSLVAGVSQAMDAVIACGMAKDPADRFPTAGALVAAAQDALLADAPSPAPIPAPVPPPRATVVDRQGAVRPAVPEPEAVGVYPTKSTPYIPAGSLDANHAGGTGGPPSHENGHGGPPSPGLMWPSASPGPDASPPPPGPATGRPAREPAWRRRGMLIVTGVVAAGIVIALVLNFTGSKTGGTPKAGNAADASKAPGKNVAASVGVPTLAATIPVGKTPSYVQVAPNGKFAYITNQNAGVITVLNTSTDQISRVITISQGPPQFVSFSPDSRTAYVSIYNDSDSVHLVAFVDTATSTVTSTVPVDNDRPGPSTPSPDGQYLYVPNHNMTMGAPNGNVIDVISTASKTLTGQIAVPMNPHWLAFGAGGHYLYSTDHMSGEVTVMNAHTNSIVKEIQVGQTPHGEAISPDGSRLAVTSFGGDFVSFINTATDKIVARVPVGKAPQDDAYAPDGRHLYTVNNGDNTVSVIDTADNHVVAVIPTGKSPTSVSVLPNGKQAYVTNEGDNTIEVLDIAK
jgi:YVTN family beta-propeller protein